jgi:hypothetical protein
MINGRFNPPQWRVNLALVGDSAIAIHGHGVGLC